MGLRKIMIIIAILLLAYAVPKILFSPVISKFTSTEKIERTK